MQDGVRSGRYGAVDGQSTVRNWAFNLLSEPKTFRASNTHGGTGRQQGIRDWNGSFGAYGGNPIVRPGQEFIFSGYTAPETNVEGGVGPIYTGPAIVDSLAVTWNWTNGDIISYVANFSGNGEVVEGEDVYLDTTSPDVPSFDSGKITIDPGDDQSLGSGSSFSEWCKLVSATLTLTAENKSAVNSCSGGWRTRVPGPLDYTLAVVAQETSHIRLPFELRDDVPLRLYTGENLYWRLKWAHVIDLTGMTVNVETGDFIQLTINFGMSGFVADETGHIIMPDLTQLWPTVIP